MRERARRGWVGPLVLLGALLAGGLVGLVGAFLVPLRVGDVPVPASPVVALVGNTVVGLGAARAAGRAGSAAAAAGWLVVVSAASVPGPGGDLVVPATGTAYAFLVVGALASFAVVGLGGLVHDRARRAPGGAAAG